MNNIPDKMILPNLFKKQIVSKKATAARSFLMKWYPDFYRKIQGYFNLGYSTEDEYFFRVKTWISFYGINYDRIKPHLLDFIGISEEPGEYVPKKLLRKRKSKRTAMSCRVLNKHNRYAK